MPKSKKRRTAKPRRMPKNMREDMLRKLTAPMPEPRPQHPGYEQNCPADLLVDEFGDEGADWLCTEYGRQLTVAEFHLEQCILKNEFVLDDPFEGPRTVTYEVLSRTIDMTSMVILSMAQQQGVLTAEQDREVRELQALGPMDYAAEGIEVVRGAFRDGAVFLNDQGMWGFDRDGGLPA